MNPIFLFSPPLQIDPNPDHASRTEERRLDACPSRWKVLLKFPRATWGAQRKPACKAQLCLFFSNNSVHPTLLTSREKYPTHQLTDKDLDKYPQLSWVGQICSCLPSARETGVTSVGLDMYRRTHIQSVWKTPLVARALLIVTDSDEEESAGLSLPSSSLTPDSSVLMAHKDMAPHTKGRTKSCPDFSRIT